jgi:hypothetical protein
MHLILRSSQRRSLRAAAVTRGTVPVHSLHFVVLLNYRRTLTFHIIRNVISNLSVLKRAVHLNIVHDFCIIHTVYSLINQATT